MYAFHGALSHIVFRAPVHGDGRNPRKLPATDDDRGRQGLPQGKTDDNA
jgi:hypothetical protein